MNMSEQELNKILSQATAHQAETEIIEFKEAKEDFHFDRIGKYFSALSNEANLKGKPCAWLIFGIEDKKHQIVGSNYRKERRKLDSLKKEIADKTTNNISFIEIYELQKPEGRVIMFQIPAAPQGIPVAFEGFYYGRANESLVALNIEKIERIRNQTTNYDWSKNIVPDATFEDLDMGAIKLMKAGYAKKQKNPAFETLPDSQVLVDLGLMINEKFNYAALILLGKRDALRKYLSNAEVIIEYRLTHSMIPYTARKEFQESLFTMMDKIWAYINQPASNPLLHVRHKFTIYDIPAFNEDVIREAVLNAIGHRLWRDLSSVVIKQYPDSINIINSGGFPDGVTKDNILTVSSKPRNKLVMEVLEKTGQVERSGQGVDKMYYNCLMEGKPLPDYSHTDDYQVELCLRAKIVDEAFYIFVNEIQDNRKEEDKLNVFDLLTLNKVRQGVSTDLFEESVEKLQHEGLIKSQSSADKKYVLGDLYYEIAKQPAYIKEYRIRDLQVIAGCFEKAKDVSMKDFVAAFENQLSRGQIKYLILKLEENKLIEKKGGGRSIKYNLNSNIDEKGDIIGQFVEAIQFAK
jgi:ATP-dependent DNA helicase RecG